MRRATLLYIDFVEYINISIHTLHAEGDVQGDVNWLPDTGISIHTLHAEGDSLQTTSG